VIAIISAGRPANVKAMSDVGWQGTWFVPYGEGDAYLDAGASDVIESGNLIDSRNVALDMAFDQGDVCVQVSDDCTKMRRLHQGEAPAALPGEFVAEALDHITANCRLVGIAPTDNAFYGGEKVKRQHFCVGDLFVAAPSPIRFDRRLRLKEDYDYTAQHIYRYGEVARLDWWLVSFTHRTNAGGVVQYRTAEVEQESIAVLREKWGNWIQPNSRRDNEVLLRVR